LQKPIPDAQAKRTGSRRRKAKTKSE